MAKKSYAWFEKNRRTKLLDLAQKQIATALDTVTLLNKAMKNISKVSIMTARPLSFPRHSPLCGGIRRETGIWRTQ